ncbi:MAG: hypothetical protein Q9216_005912 [Gyalolechia sp. 2 TL-2023]
MYLQTTYPWVKTPAIISAPMRLISLAPLAVAVSRAGGLGFISAGTDVNDLETHLQEASSLVEQEPIEGASTSTLPIGVGFINWGADLKISLQAVKRFRPAAVWFFAPYNSSDLVEWSHAMREATEGETKVWIQVGSVKDALDAAKLCKPEAIVVQGSDAGGHGLERGAGIITLFPETADALKEAGFEHISLIAAGGIAEGRGVSACLALGAEGVVMGTRFLASTEVQIAKGYQDAVLRARDGGVSTIGGRGIINQSFLDAKDGKVTEENKQAYAEALKRGDLGWSEDGRLTAYAGTGVGMIHQVQPAREILEEIRTERKAFPVGHEKKDKQFSNVFQHHVWDPSQHTSLISGQELKANIKDLRRTAGGDIRPSNKVEGQEPGSGGELAFNPGTLSENQMQRSRPISYVKHKGKARDSFGSNDLKIQAPIPLQGLPPSKEAGRHKGDGPMELSLGSEGDACSHAQQTILPIDLLNKGTREDDPSSSQIKLFPQAKWSQGPYVPSVMPSVVVQAVPSTSWARAAAYHTSVKRGYSAAAAASATLETTDTSKVQEDQVHGTGALNRHQAGSPLGYHIPLARMRESMRASTSSRSAYWQYTLYEGPKREKVIVHYCKSLETTERISKLFLNEDIIGFDIEWTPAATVKDGIRKNVATIQIASEERIAIFHIARFSKGNRVEDLVAPSFKQIMESPSITKVGVSVKSDCTRLRKFMNIDSRGTFELSHLYKLVRFASDDVKKINKKLVSLATQVEEHLMLPLFKDEKVRASDWSEELDYEQIYCELPPRMR